jgi:hypothetical protein
MSDIFCNLVLLQKWDKKDNINSFSPVILFTTGEQKTAVAVKVKSRKRKDCK